MNSLFVGFVKLLMVVGAGLYVGLVLMIYRTDGPRYRPRLALGDPGRSAWRLLVWMGVKALTATIRGASTLFNMLSEASAEVGEWFLRRRDPEVQDAFRSRFMV